MFYTPVYTLLKIKKIVGEEKETGAEGNSAAEKILAQSVLGGFLDITAASRLAGAADYTKHVRASPIYKPLIGLSSCTPGDRPIFAFPRLMKRFQSHMRVSHSHKSVA
jgi:hypothetical protein